MCQNVGAVCQYNILLELSTLHASFPHISLLRYRRMRGMGFIITFYHRTARFYHFSTYPHSSPLVCFHEPRHIYNTNRLSTYPHTGRTHKAKKICLRGEHTSAPIIILYFVDIEFYRNDIILILPIYHINITAHPYIKR